MCLLVDICMKGQDMNSEQYLKEVTLGEVTVLNDEITLEEYDENWEKLYEQEKQTIESTLRDYSITVEHVGSTSVPGLCAKPIIDILLLVEDSADEMSYVDKLEEAGYVIRIREPEWYEHRMLKKQHPVVNLHVFSKGCEEAERMLLFRDWLIQNAEDRALYAKTKRNLAKKTWKYVQEYADAKTEIVKLIMEHAEVNLGD